MKEFEQQREREIDERLADREAPAEDELLAHQGYTREDELTMAMHYEEMEREHELEMQHGGRRRCEECGEFEVESRTVSTGFDRSEYTKCRNCGHETFAG